MDANPGTTVASRLRHARRLGGWSRRGLSVASGLAQALVGQIEKNHAADPRASTIVKLAETLGVGSDWLIEGVGDAPLPETIKRAAVPQEPDDDDEPARPARGGA